MNLPTTQKFEEEEQEEDVKEPFDTVEDKPKSVDFV